MKFRYEFPPDVEAEREQAFQSLERAMHDPSEASVNAALTLCQAWLGRHPEDGAMRDAGEPVSMLADALEIVAREEQLERFPARSGVALKG